MSLSSVSSLTCMTWKQYTIYNIDTRLEHFLSVQPGPTLPASVTGTVIPHDIKSITYFQQMVSWERTIVYVLPHTDQTSLNQWIPSLLIFRFMNATYYNNHHPNNGQSEQPKDEMRQMGNALRVAVIHLYLSYPPSSTHCPLSIPSYIMRFSFSPHSPAHL